MIHAYEQGFLARRRSEPTSTCDHPAGSTHQREWIRGWTQAQADERDADVDKAAAGADD